MKERLIYLAVIAGLILGIIVFSRSCSHPVDHKDDQQAVHQVREQTTTDYTIINHKLDSLRKVSDSLYEENKQLLVMGSQYEDMIADKRNRIAQLSAALTVYKKARDTPAIVQGCDSLEQASLLQNKLIGQYEASVRGLYSNYQEQLLNKDSMLIRQQLLNSQLKKAVDFMASKYDTLYRDEKKAHRFQLYAGMALQGSQVSFLNGLGPTVTAKTRKDKLYQVAILYTPLQAYQPFIIQASASFKIQFHR